MPTLERELQLFLHSDNYGVKSAQRVPPHTPQSFLRQSSHSDSVKLYFRSCNSSIQSCNRFPYYSGQKSKFLEGPMEWQWKR